jgi:hypothetical protein
MGNVFQWMGKIVFTKVHGFNNMTAKLGCFMKNKNIFGVCKKAKCKSVLTRNVFLFVWSPQDLMNECTSTATLCTYNKKLILNKFDYFLFAKNSHDKERQTSWLVMSAFRNKIWLLFLTSLCSSQLLSVHCLC